MDKDVHLLRPIRNPNICDFKTIYLAEQDRHKHFQQYALALLIFFGKRLR